MIGYREGGRCLLIIQKDGTKPNKTMHELPIQVGDALSSAITRGLLSKKQRRRLRHNKGGHFRWQEGDQHCSVKIVHLPSGHIGDQTKITWAGNVFVVDTAITFQSEIQTRIDQAFAGKREEKAYENGRSRSIG